MLEVKNLAVCASFKLPDSSVELEKIEHSVLKKLKMPDTERQPQDGGRRTNNHRNDDKRQKLPVRKAKTCKNTFIQHSSYEVFEDEDM